MTGKQRVLAMLRRYQGVTEADFEPPDVIDGGNPIGRVAPRILDLRKDGYEIVGARLPNGTFRWSLISEPGLVGSSVVEGTPGGPACHGERASSGVPSTTEPVALFGENVGTARPRSHYEEAA